MSTRLEEFIKSNKASFDQANPPADLWSQIESKLDKKRPKLVKLSPVITIAAMLLFICSIGIIFWQYQQKQELNLVAINPEMAEQQVQFASLIEIKLKELKQIEKLDPALYREFAIEIQKMDANYQNLKKNLPDSPNPEETVKAMIWNLQIQIRVLNQQLNIIEQINQTKKSNRYENQNI